MAQEQIKDKWPRVALIASEYTISEYSSFLQRLLVGLADESIPAALVCPSSWEPSSAFTAAAEVIAHPVFNVPFMGPLNMRLLTERLMRFKPTVLHCLCESQASTTRRLAHGLDVPYVLTANSLPKRWKPLSVSSTYCTRIIVPAQSIRDRVIRAQPHLAGRMERINMGTFAAQSAQCFSEPSQVATLVAAHRFRKADEYEDFLGAVRHLLIDGYEFMMVVVGNGRADERLWKLLTALDLLRVVTLVPREIPWRSILVSADVFIRPRPSRVFDSLLLEAMGVGAAIAGCRGGVDDLIVDGQTAMVFEPNDELSIMRTLQHLLDKREAARQMATSALEYLRENHSVSRMIAATIQVYREATG
ncbi:MAG: glycosyltransferase family 4 protein [Sedimentisphaerales bacterium]